jgi:hypothetical protein
MRLDHFDRSTVPKNAVAGLEQGLKEEGDQDPALIVGWPSPLNEADSKLPSENRQELECDPCYHRIGWAVLFPTLTPPVPESDQVEIGWPLKNLCCQANLSDVRDRISPQAAAV